MIHVCGVPLPCVLQMSSQSCIGMAPAGNVGGQDLIRSKKAVKFGKRRPISAKSRSAWPSTMCSDKSPVLRYEIGAKPILHSAVLTPTRLFVFGMALCVRHGFGAMRR